ncbi:unnamed protein product [Adineta steineri]|uniref:NAD(P)(+)--arginine ADP-ribosyltransferase n=1 Tax=Adineta steineri TaxID=433720 RepID=A0A814KUC1_9BILA|nr:unnamed protein product [Adineta steineri]
MASKWIPNDNDSYNQRILDIAEESGHILTPIQGYDKQPLVTLEQAIEPIIPFVPDIKRMAFIAKVKCGKSPANDLSIDESASIILYSMDWESQEECLYHALNKTLRTENRRKLKPWFLYLRLILTALSRLPYSTHFVFRGVKCDMRKDYVEGETIYWWGFSSCTTKMGVLQNEEFLGSTGPRTLFAIECFSGKNIRQHSSFHEEAEILLPPGRQFEVVSSLDQRNGLYLIQLKETEPPFPLLQPLPQVTSSKEQANKKVMTKESVISRLPSPEINTNGSYKQAINILLLGGTGVGKSTFINALANYLVNDTFEQALNDTMQVIIPFSFDFITDYHTFETTRVCTGKSDEYEVVDKPSETNTRKCRSFVFTIGNKLMRVIDTPPVGDTRGVEQDIANSKEINAYIAQYEHLDGICIFLRPNEEILSVSFRYCVQGLIHYLPKNTMENIMFIFTNVRATYYRSGSTSRILSVLSKKNEEKFGVHIRFTKENTFFLENQGLQYLSVHREGIRISCEVIHGLIKSFNHTKEEYARLIFQIATRPIHIRHDIHLLFEVREILKILLTCIIPLSTTAGNQKHSIGLQNEKMQIENPISNKFLIGV